MKNIVLIGMPGTGKSVVGRALAQRLDYGFIDVDDLIVEKAGKPLSEILRSEGLESFLALEGQVGEVLTRTDTVIATGGSMVLSSAAMENLRKNGVVVWLETPLSQISDRMPADLTDRGIAAPAGMTIRQILQAEGAAVCPVRRPYRRQPGWGGGYGPSSRGSILRTVGVQL